MSATMQRRAEQPSNRASTARFVLGVGIAAFVSAGTMWLLPAATPPPARDGVGMGLLVLLLFLITRMAPQGRLTVQVVVAVVIGAGAALVSWMLRALLL